MCLICKFIQRGAKMQKHDGNIVPTPKTGSIIDLFSYPSSFSFSTPRPFHLPPPPLSCPSSPVSLLCPTTSLFLTLRHPPSFHLQPVDSALPSLLQLPWTHLRRLCHLCEVGCTLFFAFPTRVLSSSRATKAAIKVAERQFYISPENAA